MVALAVPAALWGWPGENLERGMLVFSTMSVWFLALLAFEIWLLLYHRMVGLLGAALGVGAIVLLATGIVEVTKDGDLYPTAVRVHLFGPRTRDLEDHRTIQGESSPATSDDLLTVTEADCAEYRGARRDGVMAGPALARDWKAQPPRSLWRQPVGGGYAGFAVAGRCAVTIEQRREKEAVVCYDTDTGRERWVYDYPASFTEPLGGPGPRATPTVHEGDVYSLGALGHLACLDGRTGNEKWAVNILEGNGNIMWAMSGSPLVYKDVVIVNPGVQKQSESLRALVAYDRKTGERRWGGGTTKAGYASPMLATLAGIEQIVLFDGVEIAGYDVNNGAKFWSFRWKTHQDINVAQPLILDGDRVFVSSGYGVGSAMLQIAKSSEQWQVKELWRSRSLRSKFSSPTAYQGFIYGFDDGGLVCLDEKDGTRQWKGSRYGHGQMLRHDDLLLILAENGKLALVEATPQEFRELAKLAAIEGRTWNYPALARGRIYVRNDVEMACYELK